MIRPILTAWRFAVNLMRLKNVGLARWITEYEMEPGHVGVSK
jgi:hypothetical protein